LKKIDPYLKAVLDNFTTNYFASRDRAFSGLDFESLRQELAEIREQSLERNQELLNQFIAQAEKLGSKVILAKDSEEANQNALNILKKHRINKLVKSKSMVSEETRLNDFLIENGIEVRETDLGEWIIQLDKEHPTHMVLPAIHLTRKDVAKIFSKKLGREITDDPALLVRIAREQLRKDIFEAGAGLTGANALIADTGAMMMVTNEGNGRLVSTIPPVHIVFTSVEKLYANLSQVFVLLKMLPRNATGQVITSYVSLIAGPHNQAQYIILVDNHRSELMADSVFKPVLRCIKCSACLNICPVYRLLGGKQYSHIYMGGIGTLLTAWIHGLEQSKDLAGLCLNCHRCDESCAVKIPIADLIIALREKLNLELGKPVFKEMIFDLVIAHQNLHQTLFKMARTARPLLKTKDNFARKLPAPFGKYERFRALPLPAEKSLTELWKTQSASTIKEQGLEVKKLQLYPGCLVEHFYPEIGIDAAKVLNRLGYQVDLIEAGCCGFPALNAGFREAGEGVLAQLMKKIKAENTIITLCPTCTLMLKRAGEKLSSQVFPFNKFIFEKELGSIQNFVPDKKLNKTICYHESCHQKHSLKANEASLELLKILAGENFIELKNADSCCGFAGSFSLDHPEISEALAMDKIYSIRESGAEVLALDCPGCLLQIKGACYNSGLKIQVLHLAQILASYLL